MKENSMIGNGVNFSFGHFQSVSKVKHGMQWGVEARLDYSKFDKDHYAPKTETSIPYNNGTSSPVILPLTLETAKKKPDAFHFLIGPSALIFHKKFLFQPSLLAGYASVSQEEFRYTTHIVNPANTTQTAPVVIFSGFHETNNGFVIVPGIKAGYRLHKNIAALLNLEYSLGSKQVFPDRLYKPAGTASASGYDYNQMTSGSQIILQRESKLRAFIANFNIAFTLPKHR
jgi:hypothetical protein